jgi:hypothetical protein
MSAAGGSDKGSGQRSGQRSDQSSDQSSGGRSGGALKSAYEAALARLDLQGIDRPAQGALSDGARQAIAEARRRGEAKLAELEILHRDKLKGLRDPLARGEAEEHYRRDRRRVEESLERELARLRKGA